MVRATSNPTKKVTTKTRSAAVRLAELDKACDILGVSALERLGYHDSGMPEWRHRHRDDVFCNVPIEVAADRLIALFEQYQPDVVATYADNGGYNHPDHLHAHHITVAAVERSRIPAKLYYIARRRRDFQRLRDAMRAQGLEPPNQPPPDPERMARITEQMEAIEKRITTSIDVGPVVDLKRAALMAHASQLDESWFSKMPPELYLEFFQEEAFIRAATPRERRSRKTISSPGSEAPEDRADRQPPYPGRSSAPRIRGAGGDGLPLAGETLQARTSASTHLTRGNRCTRRGRSIRCGRRAAAAANRTTPACCS